MTTIVLDIETGKAPEDDLQRRLSEIKITKDAQKKGKTAIEKERVDKENKIRSDANLYDTSPINVIGLLIDGQTLILTTLPETPIDTLTVQCFETEQAMLAAAKGIFEAFVPEEAVLITFNGYRFDVPRILCRMGYYGIAIPAFLREVEHFDVMYKFCNHFSIENDRFIKFHRCCELLGINGKAMEFKEAEQFLEAGDVATFLNYNALDLVRTYQCYQRMT